jgi:ElaB/YqjD/DUF883 family membrane-anchored ribosome-binding protein
MDQANTPRTAPANTNDTLVRAVNKASSGMHDKVDQMSAAARPAVDRMAAGAHRSVDSVAAVASRAADAIGTKGEQLNDARVRASTQVQGYVQENPWMALGLAAAAGFLISRLVSSRSDR